MEEDEESYTPKRVKLDLKQFKNYASRLKYWQLASILTVVIAITLIITFSYGGITGFVTADNNLTSIQDQQASLKAQIQQLTSVRDSLTTEIEHDLNELNTCSLNLNQTTLALASARQDLSAKTVSLDACNNVLNNYQTNITACATSSASLAQELLTCQSEKTAWMNNATELQTCKTSLNSCNALRYETWQLSTALQDQGLCSGLTDQNDYSGMSQCLFNVRDNQADWKVINNLGLLGSNSTIDLVLSLLKQ